MQKAAYLRRISDWSSDVCSSDLRRRVPVVVGNTERRAILQFRLAHSVSRQFAAGIHGPVCATAHPGDARVPEGDRAKIGREACRERVCQSVKSWGEDGQVKKKATRTT